MFECMIYNSMCQLMWMLSIIWNMPVTNVGNKEYAATHYQHAMCAHVYTWLRMCVHVCTARVPSTLTKTSGSGSYAQPRLNTTSGRNIKDMKWIHLHFRYLWTWNVNLVRHSFDFKRSGKRYMNSEIYWWPLE